jgi:chorismate mutase
MKIRGIRGAITIDQDTEDKVLSATQELINEIFISNPYLRTEDIASAIFTTTNAIRSAFPARAARQIGWEQVPTLCANEIPILDSLPLCIRVLIHWNTDSEQKDIKHVYLRDAENLRPDLSKQVSN